MENDDNLDPQKKNEDLTNNIQNFQNLLFDEENIEEGEYENTNNLTSEKNDNYNNNNINEMKTEKLLQKNLNLTYFKENEQRAFYIDTIIVSSHVSSLISISKNIFISSLSIM